MSPAQAAVDTAATSAAMIAFFTAFTVHSGAARCEQQPRLWNVTWPLADPAKKYTQGLERQIRQGLLSLFGE